MMHNQRPTAGTRARAHDRGEVGGVPHPVGRRQHGRLHTGRNGDRRQPRLRPTARCGPCDGAPRRSPGRPGYASATGNHASWRGGDYSAGRCACSRSYSIPEDTIPEDTRSIPGRAGTPCCREQRRLGSGILADLIGRPLRYGSARVQVKPAAPQPTQASGLAPQFGERHADVYCPIPDPAVRFANCVTRTAWRRVAGSPRAREEFCVHSLWRTLWIFCAPSSVRP